MRFEAFTAVDIKSYNFFDIIEVKRAFLAK
jgi:hypothetical protein